MVGCGAGIPKVFVKFLAIAAAAALAALLTTAASLLAIAGADLFRLILIGPPHLQKFGWMGVAWVIAFAIWMSPRRLRPLPFIRQFGIV